jgi:uncharacterized protein
VTARSASPSPDPRVPLVDRDSRPWWEALARHELVLQRCDECAAWRWPARAICGRCSSFEWTWQPISGHGEIASWVVNHHAFSAAFASPYAVVTVRLAEQDDVALVGSWQGDIGALRIDLPVVARFDDVDGPEGDPPVTLLTWGPAPTGPA